MFLSGISTLYLLKGVDPRLQPTGMTLLLFPKVGGPQGSAIFSLFYFQGLN